MDLQLYKALKSISIPEDFVDAAITAMDAHIDQQINLATAPVLARLDALSSEIKSGLAVNNGKLDAIVLIKSDADRVKELRAQRNRWIAGYVVTLVAYLSGWLHTVGVVLAGWLHNAGII